MSLLDLDSLELVEDLRIGSRSDPEIGFSRVGQVRVRADGTIFVVEELDQEIRAYDVDGTELYRIGRRGEGPGEFHRISDLGFLDDTVWVRDGGLNRLTLLSTRGEVYETIPAGGVSVSVPGIERIVPWFPREDGLIAGAHTAFYGGTGIPDSVELPRLIFDREGTVVDTMGTYFVTLPVSRTVEVKLGRAGVALEPPADVMESRRFPVDGPGIMQRPSPDGWVDVEPVVVSLAGGSARYVISRIGAEGDSLFSRSYMMRMIPPSKKQVDQMAQEMMRVFEDASPEEIEDALRATDIIPEYWYPIISVRAGIDGSLWLRLATSEQAQAWAILDSAGGAVGILSLPLGSMIRAVSLSQVWVVEHDELDVPFVLRYELARVQ